MEITKSRKLQDAGDLVAEAALEANLKVDPDQGNVLEQDDAADLAARDAGVSAAKEADVLRLVKERDPENPKPLLEVKNKYPMTFLKFSRNNQIPFGD